MMNDDGWRWRSPGEPPPPPPTELDDLRLKVTALEVFLERAQQDLAAERANAQTARDRADAIAKAAAGQSAQAKAELVEQLRAARTALEISESTLAFERVELARVRAALATALGDRAQPPVAVPTLPDEDFDA